MFIVELLERHLETALAAVQSSGTRVLDFELTPRMCHARIIAVNRWPEIMRVTRPQEISNVCAATTTTRTLPLSTDSDTSSPRTPKPNANFFLKPPDKPEGSTKKGMDEPSWCQQKLCLQGHRSEPRIPIPPQSAMQGTQIATNTLMNHKGSGMGV